MPAKPRSEIMDPRVCGTYHITSRCVRRAFLCGEDRYADKDYSHRRDWIQERVRELAAWFGIDVVYNAWMANHFHLILRNLPQLVAKWTDEEVIRRCCLVFPYKFRRMGVKRGVPTPEQLRALTADRQLLETMRERLADPSWFMRQLNQKVARQANQEDQCTGRFFEGRFHSQKIEDELGVLICGIYVDLNPIAAQEAKSPETSIGTSAFLRIRGRAARRAGSAEAARWDGFLAPLHTGGDGQDYSPPGGQFGSARASDRGLLDLTLDDYLSLLDWVGRQLRPGKRGRIDDRLPPILERLEMESPDNSPPATGGPTAGEWLCTLVDQFDSLFKGTIAAANHLLRLVSPAR